MASLDGSAIVTPMRVAYALRKGDLNGVLRLAEFVGASSADPWEVYEACQKQRFGKVIM